MCNEKQLLANRQNALSSTGPRTIEGKSRSAQNALKHGMCCDSILPTEDQLAYDMFCDEMQDSLRPKSPAETMLAERITQLTWRLRRLPAAESEIFNQLQPQDINPQSTPSIDPLTSAEQLALCFIHKDDRSNPFTRLQRYESHLQRSLTHCYKHLRALQEYREAHPRTYDSAEYAPPTNTHPNAPDSAQTSHLQSSTTNNEPQPTSPELPNEPISPPTPPSATIIDSSNLPLPILHDPPATPPSAGINCDCHHNSSSTAPRCCG